MIVRNDLRKSSTVIPKELKVTVLRVGGTNPFGEPLFRLILAEDRTVRAAGEWSIWSDDVPAEERGSLGIDIIQKMLTQYQRVMEAAVLSGLSQNEIDKMAYKLTSELDEILKSKLSAAPIRVESGMADVPLYPFDGFIIEKWKPAETFGSPGDWNQFTFEGQSALGPYPEFGDYELCAGPTPHMPTSAQLEDAIRQDFRQIEAKPKSAQQRLLLMLQKIEQRQKQKQKETQDRALAMLRDGPASLRNRLSLGAGRVIQEMATKAGLKGHYGN